MIKKSIVLTSIVIIIASCSILKVSKQANLSSDLSIAKQYSKYINKNDLKNNLTVLASDDFEGRETTKKGQKKAAEFIKEFFVNNNVQPPKQNQYFQNFSVNVTDYKRINIVVNNEELKILCSTRALETILIKKDKGETCSSDLLALIAVISASSK